MSFYDYQGNEIKVGTSADVDTGLPVVSIDGTLPTSKNDGNVNVVITYKSASENFQKYATLKVQGDSSTLYPKKNFTVKLYSDSERTTKYKVAFRDWDKTSKFVLKANWVDHSHARNIVNARLWTQIYKSRSDYDNLPTALKESYFAVDGFPVKVYANGIYMGVYTWNRPKDSMYGLKDSIETNSMIQGYGSYGGANLWRSSTYDNKWEEQIHDEVFTASTIAGLNRALNFVYTSSDTDFVNNFSDYFDKQSIIDQYIFLYAACIVDNLAKNQTYFTYDSQKWFGGMYDLDGTWGCPPYPPAKSTWYDYNTEFQSGYTAVTDGDKVTTNLLYERVQNLLTSEIKTRYAELRTTVLSEGNIDGEFERFMSEIPPYIYEEDYASTTGDGAFTNIPLKTSNNILQIRQFVKDRLAYVDEQIEAL